ncbi:MAG: hypothetical protein HY302_15590 [Opitutae bacterium]|nr:hypothetical protein [Opitutae bacterium]
MNPKIKSRPANEKISGRTVEPVVAHEVTQQTASANAASRQRRIAVQPASGTANHARHHAARKAQS